MHNHTLRDRPERTGQTAHQIPGPAATERQIQPVDLPPPSEIVPPTAPDPAPNPYVDYSRTLTPEGGILIVYKGEDGWPLPFLLRFIIWLALVYAEASFVLHLLTGLASFLWIVGFAALSAIILIEPDFFRSIEIRPDCMIINGKDVFWRKHMECGWPEFRAGENKSRVLTGIYGTRFVEYLTVPHFEDEFDRTQQVLESHLRDAMKQLWSRRF
jgi:hypothetical protein